MMQAENVIGLRKPQTAATVTNKVLTSNVATLTLSGSAAAQFATGRPAAGHGSGHGVRFLSANLTSSV